MLQVLAGLYVVWLTGTRLAPVAMEVYVWACANLLILQWVPVAGAVAVLAAGMMGQAQTAARWIAHRVVQAVRWRPTTHGDAVNHMPL